MLTKVGYVVREDSGTYVAALGSWWWVKTTRVDYEEGVSPRWLGCVTKVGSNYVELTGLDPATADSADTWRGSRETRIHDDVFEARCTPEPDPDGVIAREVERRRQLTQHLLEQIKDVTARLALQPGPAGETAAIAVRADATPVHEYKAALVKAQTKTLPALFKQVENTNAGMAKWLKVQLLPLQAQVAPLKDAMATIEGRIFNVELYAGLVEQVVQIVDGAPAALTEPVHLFQRRHYMDEECLANYRAGGMEFKHLSQFDEWLAAPENRDRILPFPRSIVAMQVRRYDKEREFPSFSAYINFIFSGEKELDKTTFLYIRNGDQLHRLTTKVTFDEHLFPDLNRAAYDGALYAQILGDQVQDVITEGHYLAKVQEERAADLKYKEELAAYKAEVAAAKAAGLKPRDTGYPTTEPWRPHHLEPSSGYVPWSPDSVYYDDVTAYIGKQIEAHNRIVLILQGLLDRSPVLHPHPSWKLWDPQQFQLALVLQYDGTALTSGTPPDFEVYRARLNATLKVGDLTVGQDDYWSRQEAVKQNARANRSYRDRYYEQTHFRPYGNPGPGMVAPIVKVGRGSCTFRWVRKRQTYQRWADDPTGPVPCTLTVPITALLNVSAYTPGDYRVFYQDPQTRADYLKWAPLLLEAEDHYARNR